MITVRNIYTGLEGVTVGQRKDGSRAVLFEDNSLDWFDEITFNSFYDSVNETWLSEPSILAEEV